MVFGIILVVAGLFLFWQVSGILGGIARIAGAVMIGLQFTQAKDTFLPRDYQSSAPTFNLKSTYRK